MTTRSIRLRTVALAIAIAVALVSCRPAVPAPHHVTTEQALAAADEIAADVWAASGLPGPLPDREETLIDCIGDLGASIEVEYHRLDESPESREAVEAVRRYWDSSPVEELFGGNRLETRSNIDGFNTLAAWASGEPGLRILLATTECYPDAPDILG